MSTTKLEGDTKDISEKQLQFILSVLEKHGFGDASVTILPIGKPGDNYCANVKRIIATKDGGEQMNMIAKVAPNKEVLRMMGQTRYLFCNENFMYTEVIPKFMEMEKAAGIPEQERLRFAKFYDSTLEMLNEVILLEDLQLSGFTMQDRFQPLSDNDIKLVLKDFGKLHSLSFALKHKEPGTFDLYKNTLADLWGVFQASGMTTFFDQIENDVMGMMEGQKYKDSLKGIVSQVADNMANLHKMDVNTRYTVVQQGDAWTNNMMFQLEDGNSKQCCMIDFQQSRVNSPVADLVYFLFCCTDYESRSQHFQEWIDYYYSQLDQSLSSFGLKANYVYSRDQLDADLKRHGRASLGQAVLLAAMMIRDSAEAAKFKELMEKGMDLEEVMKGLMASAMDMGSIVRYKSKIEGLVDSHLELGLL